jgi:cytochrome c oxidase cbb3-type subunit 2
MPGFPWLEETPVGSDLTKKKMQVFRDSFGVPYGDDAALEADVATLEGKTEMDALIAYLQSLGKALK